ncbi:unnamed protein product [Protopolystoma xenopodis]|uniref:Uncharacterized protein n=1 Tax=Protopolystoma xenopodis TaxID=117903 RepID=A0A448WCG8_9PLAT|nr:unnamed protein product [Protopolystoma xenopodis]
MPCLPRKSFKNHHQSLLFRWVLHKRFEPLGLLVLLSSSGLAKTGNMTSSLVNILVSTTDQLFCDLLLTDKSGRFDRYSLITVSRYPELHIRSVTKEELARLSVRCVFQSVVPDAGVEVRSAHRERLNDKLLSIAYELKSFSAQVNVMRPCFPKRCSHAGWTAVSASSQHPQRESNHDSAACNLEMLTTTPHFPECPWVTGQM